MHKNGRHQFRRQYVRLKGWLTLGSIGILPRLIIAFASVGALAATANLIVEKGVASVPGSSFFSRPELGRHLVRFAFCKTDSVLEAAARKLSNHVA